MTATRYLLVGGSNSLVKGGFGASLQAAVRGRWRNESLGASPSLRGVDYLVHHPELVSRTDVIVFEYALNDSIFETSNTLEPLTHLGWLRSIAAQRPIAEKLRFVLLQGRRAAGMGARRESFVMDNYRQVSAEFGIPCIDLLPSIDAAVAEHGLDGTFSDPDHFAPQALPRLVADAAKYLLAATAAPSAPTEVPVPSLRSVDPLTEGRGEHITRMAFKTSLLKMSLARLEAGSRLTIVSPGGLLVGFYAQSVGDAGAVRISLRGHDVIKPMRYRGAPARAFVALRPMSAPLHTAAGEEILIRHVDNAYAVPGATIDSSRGQLLHAGGPSVAVGRFLFMTHEP